MIEDDVRRIVREEIANSVIQTHIPRDHVRVIVREELAAHDGQLARALRAAPLTAHSL
jgi:hypothetical protein